MSSLRLILLALPVAVLLGPVPAELAVGERESGDAIAPEEYEIYNRIVESKFLTSDTALVLIHELTAVRLGPSGLPFSREWFEENQVFEGRVPRGLIADFLAKTHEPSRLAAEFDFGVRYRLISRDEGQRERVSLPPGPVHAIQSVPATIFLEFSRVAFTPKEDLGLVYVGNERPDGTGAGMLMLLRRSGREWHFVDTEIVWTVRDSGP
jgi:hypothetical protein